MGEKIVYDTIFARSFSRSDQKKLGYGAFLGCLLIALSFCLVFKPYSPPLSVGVNLSLPKMVCTSEERSDFCELNGDVTIDATSSTVYVSASPQEAENSSTIIQPYTRKEDMYAMKSVRKWSLEPIGVDTNLMPQCDQTHQVPAILFSLGGYSGNNYHDFTDIIIPLFSAARPFNGEVKLLVTDKNPWWVNKFKVLLQKLSNYEVIDIDDEETVHCFISTTLIVGLKRNPNEMSIDPSSPYTMKDFRQFLRSVYSLNKATTNKIKTSRTRPRLLILSRNRTRAFTNIDEIGRTGRDMGFEVVVAEARGNITRFAKIVNSCDVMMGVHGAGLTNMVYLPEGAVLIQVIPFGVANWLVRSSFGEPSKAMNISYLEYKIEKEESSLIQQYPPEHEVLSNPFSIFKQGWLPFKAVYLDNQNVKLDVNRFKLTLQTALELLRAQ